MKVTRGDFRDFGPRIVKKNSINFTVAIAPTTKKAAIHVFDKVSKKKLYEIELTDEYSIGRVYSIEISDVDVDKLGYLIKEDDKVYVDPYATTIIGRDIWADDKKRAASDFKIYSGIAHLEKSWKDTDIYIEPTDMVIYKLHMRGFTAGMGMSAARVGSYKGVLSKLSYLKELGITSIEFMPLYDFEELFLEPKMTISPKGKVTETTEYTGKRNYWGYGEANYFAPKASYFGGADKCVDSMRDMIATLHSNGFEAIMEMAFAKDITAEMMLKVLEYYVQYFHVDGFHIVGCNAPIERIVANPFLADTKIFYEYIPEEILCNESGKKHLFIYNDSFMNVTRQIENHMNGSMVQFANHMRRQNQAYGFWS